MKRDKMKQAKKKSKEPIRKSGSKGEKPAGQRAAASKKSAELRVLILEDTPADAELMERLLRKEGIGLISQRVNTRSGFLQTLKTFKPDLILADYSLPKFNALQALALCKKNAPLTPFIIVTGSISEEIAVECMKQGADDYLLKNHLARLGEAVRHSLTNHRLQEEKDRAEATLRANELLYHTFINSSTDIAFLKDSRFRHLLANQALCSFFGKPEKEIIGKTDSQLMGKSAATKCRSSDKQALAENRIHVHEETVNGLTFETRKFPVKLTDGRIGVGGYIRDISERKRAQGQIEQAAKKWTTTFDAIRDGIALLAVDQTVRQVNQAFANLVNKPFREIIGKKCYELVHPDRQPDPHCPFAKMLKSKKRESIELAVADRMSEILVDPITNNAGTITGAAHIITDITERKKMDDELKNSEIRYHNLFENSSEFFYTLDLKGNFTDVNKAALSLTGYTKSELLKMNFKDYTPKRDHRKLFLALSNIYKTGKPFQNLLVEAIIKDKSKKYFETSISLMKKGEQIIGFQGSSKDITERKRTEAQINASLLEKEVLLKEIHHRVKNNLQIISGLLTLQAAQTNDERLQGMIKGGQSRIWTMALIHQTLYQSGNLADIDMADYIHSLAGNLLSSHAQVAMPPTVSFDLLPVRLLIDKAIPLALIINELVTNAIKHAFPDSRPGEIRITLHECRGAEFCVPTEDTGTAPSYELTVADNGAGLPVGFDPKNQKSLGLQLVDMLTKQLGGSLAIESRGGTSVRIIFSNNEKSEKQS